MQNRQEVIAFYIRHDIIPNVSEVVPNLWDYLKLFFEAYNMDERFGMFARESLQAISYCEYKMIFKSWDSLFECYEVYCIGEKRNKQHAK